MALAHRRRYRRTGIRRRADKSPPAGALAAWALGNHAQAGRRAFLLSDRNRQLKFETAHTDTISVMNDAIATTARISLDSVSPSESEILTVSEVARFLRVPKSTVYKLARLGDLPASKIGKHWRFLRRDIHEWMHGRTQHN